MIIITGKGRGEGWRRLLILIPTTSKESVPLTTAFDRRSGAAEADWKSGWYSVLTAACLQ